MPAEINLNNIGSVGIRPDPPPGVGVNIPPSQFAAQAAGLGAAAGVGANLLPYVNIGLAVGLPLLAKIFEQKLPIQYPQVGIRVQPDAPERHIFGETMVEPVVLWAGTRDHKITSANTLDNLITPGCPYP